MGKQWSIHSSGHRLHGKKPCRWLPNETCTFQVYTGRTVFTLTSQRWVGIWVAARVGRGSTVDTPTGKLARYRRPVVKRKDAVVGKDGAKNLACLDLGPLENLRPLFEHCAVIQYDDLSPRETGWVTIKTMGAAWVVQVKDPDSGNSFQAVAETPLKALETAVLLLSCDEAPWASDPFLKRKRGK